MAIIFEKTNLGRYVLKIGDAENCLKNSKNAHTHAMYVSLRLRKKKLNFPKMAKTSDVWLASDLKLLLPKIECRYISSSSENSFLTVFVAFCCTFLLAVSTFCIISRENDQKSVYNK